MSKIIIYAPNINTGGGKTLLYELLNASNKSVSFFLDSRLRGSFNERLDLNIKFISPDPLSRLWAEVLLLKESKESDNLVFCLNGIPPLLNLNSRVILYLHNKLLLINKVPNGYSFSTFVSLYIQRKILKWKLKSIDTVMVQTASMENLLKNWIGSAKISSLNIRIYPFANIKPSVKRNYNHSNALPKVSFDFCYIADGQPHKNHLNLFKALEILSKKNILPSVAITLSEKEVKLLSYLNCLKLKKQLRVKNLGVLTNIEVIDLLMNSKALIFPSTQESFGLPLVEATSLGRPIVASELDYVRDVCVPQETFDPNSPRSIARAIRRFMILDEPLQTIANGDDLLSELQKH